MARPNISSSWSETELSTWLTHTCLRLRHRCPAAMSYPVTSQPQCASSCYQTQLSDWHTGLTDCCNDMPVCLCGTFAPLCLACRISDDFGECCCAPYLPGGLHSLRTGMRERYHIQGSVGHDWAALTFCLPCALCQMARELKIRE
ncbi:cornifelin isoform X1 [Ailuropoda melanoleuca]|uniref:cornifelin isoform X1 n=1 Tax=Ailuropoda melanoleuca TaxID=9646 RepID=UPI001494659D|nr:cornifelin isoform X1 [Ailuropoda melanoleuca]